MLVEVRARRIRGPLTAQKLGGSFVDVFGGVEVMKAVGRLVLHCPRGCRVQAKLLAGVDRRCRRDASPEEMRAGIAFEPRAPT